MSSNQNVSPEAPETAGWFVEVIESKGSKVVKSIPFTSYSNAERVERGVQINLNHEQFHTKTVHRSGN